MDHAYTLGGTRIIKIENADVLPSTSSSVPDDQDLDESVDNELDEADQYDDEYDQNEDHGQNDSMEDDQDESGYEHVARSIDVGAEGGSARLWKIYLPTEEWMQMLPPQYLLQYIRERTVFRNERREEARDRTAPLKRGWLQGAWRETLRDLIAKQTDIPCIFYFYSSNFLKQPFSRKVGAPLWRVRACCRQDDGLCQKFYLKVEDFHPSKPQVEIIITAEGTLMSGPEGKSRHTITASDQMKSMKNIQRHSLTQPALGPNGFADKGDSFMEDDGYMRQLDDDTVQRYQLTIPTQEWISFLPADAAAAYVLERSRMTKDRLSDGVQEVWQRRSVAPRVSKECRQYLKAALAAKTGLPCRIGLTGRCHLKPPFSRKKRAPLFVTSGFCCRRDNKCLSFTFIVQDFNPEDPLVYVSAEVRGTLLTGPEGEERHSKRGTDDTPARRLKRISVEEVEALAAEHHGKRPRGGRRIKATARRSTVLDPAAQAVEAMEADTWPSELGLQTAEVELDNSKEQAASDAGGHFTGPQIITEGTGEMVDALQVLAEAQAGDQEEPEMGEDATRELVELANQVLNGTSADGEAPKYTASKIVQRGDQVFIFLSEPDEEQVQELIDGVEGSNEVVTTEGEVITDEIVTSDPVHIEDTSAPADEEYAVSGEGPTAIRGVSAKMELVSADETYIPPQVNDGSGQVVHVQEAQDDFVLAQYQAAVNAQKPTVVSEYDGKCMEYRWEMVLSMSDWLALLPPKSLRYYVHERTVSREVWVEEGWEKQFRSQTLQNGWRQLIRRAVVEQTDIPCQICFRGRSSLKLPFSRKHAAALWRTQGYCAKGDGKCLIYKFCVQDFHPDHETVTVEVVGTGVLDRQCARHFTGKGVEVTHAPLTKDWPEEEPRGDEPMQEEEEPWQPDIRLRGEYPPPSTREEGKQTSNEYSTCDEFYNAACKSVDMLKQSVQQARRCPLKMQAVLRLVRNVEQVVAAACKVSDCLCRPTRTVQSTCKPRLRWSDKARNKSKGGGTDSDPDWWDSGDASTGDDTPMSPDRSLTGSSPPPLTALSSQQKSQKGSLKEAMKPRRLVMQKGRPMPVTSTPRLTPRPTVPISLSTTVSSPDTITSTGPRIIRLTPAQIEANKSQPAPSKFEKLSSAIERYAMPTPSVIRPVTKGAGAGLRVSGVTSLAKSSAGSQDETTSSDQEDEDDPLNTSLAELEAGSDPAWIVDEMRRVILGEEAMKQSRAEAKNKAAKEAAEKAKGVAEKSKDEEEKLSDEGGKLNDEGAKSNDEDGKAEAPSKEAKEDDGEDVSVEVQPLGATLRPGLRPGLRKKFRVTPSLSPVVKLTRCATDTTTSPTKTTAPTPTSTRAVTRNLSSPGRTPSKASTSAPTRTPTAPSRAPTSAPTRTPSAPTSTTSKTPTNAPNKTPTSAPSTSVTSLSTTTSTNAPASAATTRANAAKVVVSSCQMVNRENPPPLVRISRASPTSNAQTTSSSATKGSRFIILGSGAKPAEPSVVPAGKTIRTVQTRKTALLEEKKPTPTKTESSSPEDDSMSPKSGKVLILRPSTVQLRSSSRKT